MRTASNWGMAVQGGVRTEVKSSGLLLDESTSFRGYLVVHIISARSRKRRKRNRCYRVHLENSECENSAASNKLPAILRCPSLFFFFFTFSFLMSSVVFVFLVRIPKRRDPKK